VAKITPRRSPDGSCIGGKVTLLFGAHDIKHNNAVALVDYLAAN
jgi:uncharacterized protein YeaO (DUF488 family)